MEEASRILNPSRSVFSFDFEHHLSHDALPALLGGKGFSLWLMRTVLGLPVPPGFTIGTDECEAYQSGGLDASIKTEVRAALERVGMDLGRHFGDWQNPLLVSVRSGAAASMPGMMDTILNVGMTPEITGTLARTTNSAVFALQSYLRFLFSFAATVHGIHLERPHDLPIDEVRLKKEIASARAVLEDRIGKERLDDPWSQLFDSIGAVFSSWNSARAIAYRARVHAEDARGTAVTVQAMVFGNFDEHSGTGVAFTRNPSTGDPAPCGDFLFRAQGDDVVGGVSRTLPLDAFERAMPASPLE